MTPGVSRFRTTAVPDWIWTTLLLTVAMPLFAGKPKPEHPYRYSVLDIPVSLAKGTIRTPEFTATKTKYYTVMVQVEKITPFDQLDCWLTTAARPTVGDDVCTGEWDRLLQVEWNLWQGNHKIASGVSQNHARDAYTQQYIFKFLGDFPAKKGQAYTLDLTFMKDSSPIDVNKPHLIVVAAGDE